jgi:phenylalanyl-tRNA synthetase beta chain
MKVPLKWLKEYVDVTVPPVELAKQLTMAGSEVKGMEVVGGSWGENIMVGQIVAVNPHPNADRLSLPTVNIGTEQQTVVCGAKNLRVGDKVVFAKAGAELIDGHTGEMARLKPAKIRGVVSSGMVCSEKELGLSDNHEEILVLPSDAPVGVPLAEYLGDVIFDLDITPNRPDCLSVIGVAWETAALTEQSLHVAEITYKEELPPIEEQVSVEIVAPDLCPRYCASLITGAKIAESPQWLQQRLIACGMRPINNVVDITNYVMLEYGQPLHAFDYQQIRGKKIIVRRAADKEVLVTLDGVERTLADNMLVIADAQGAVAVAGVMGGAGSEVMPGTTTILLEAASFKPTSIHYTSRALNLSSEASMRFERGISPELTVPALRRATQLIAELGGGRVAGGWIDVYPGKQKQKPISLSTSEVKRILGVEFSLDQIIKTLVSLSFECKEVSTSEISVAVPYWRSDVRQEIDLIEEVARIIGYDEIPMTMLSDQIPRQNPAPILAIKDKVRQTLVGYGFQEVLTYSLTSLELLTGLLPEPHPLEPMPLRVANPMTKDQEYLRPNLRANLLAALASNQRHEDSGLWFFELDKVYLPRENNLPEEPEMLCGVMCGPRWEQSWTSSKNPPDFYAAKGIVESLLCRLGVSVSFAEAKDETLHPVKQAAIVVKDNKLGVVGELHPKVAEAFEISGTVCLFEINLRALLPHTTDHRMYQPVPRFPAIVRDIALVVDAGITHQKAVEIIKSSPLVTGVALFDVYTGEQVPPGKKSLAYRITFQSPTDTLTDEKVDGILQHMLSRLTKEIGATLRQ